MKKAFLLKRFLGIIIALLVVCAVLIFGLVTIQWAGFLFLLFIVGIILIALLLYTFFIVQHFSQHHILQEQIIERDRLRLLTLVNSLGEAVFAVDKSGKITIYNSAALELIDSHEDIYGRQIDKVFHLVNVRNEPESSVRKVLEHGRIIMRDDLILRTKRADINVYLNITPIKEKGELVGAILLARDISKQKDLESQKDEFLSVISHELRTPVAVIEADLSTVLLPKFAKIPPKALKLLRSASQNLTYLSGLLQDISDLSHSERAILDTEIVSFTAQKLAHELADDFSNQASKVGLKISLDVSEKPIEIVSSYQRVREILVNFITNAIKYSQGRGKFITIEVTPSKKFSHGACFSIVDRGIGMSEADLKCLFKKFFRSADKKVQQIKGTGMGLYIAQKQAIKLGAYISVSSKLGQGSKFSLDVPAELLTKAIISTS